MKIVAVCTASILMSAYAIAQTVSGFMSGIVLDATQAAVAHANITAIEQSK